MKLDGANRNFFALLGTSLVTLYLTLGAGACVILSLLAWELATNGLGVLTSFDTAVWSALVFLALVAAGAIAGVHSLVRQIRASHRLARRVRAQVAPGPPQLAEAVRRAGLAGRVCMLESAERFSFAYGAFAPRVAISRGLVEAASREELGAVLEHERYHVHNLDPLKVLLARALPAAAFYVPALRHLRARYIAGRELAADRRAVETCGRRPLAGALFKVIDAPRWPELGAAAAIGGPDLLGVRIEQLETGTEPRSDAIPRRLVVFSAAGVAAVTGAFLLAVVTFGGVEAVVRVTMLEADFRALDMLLVLACVLPWVAAGWLGYAWLARRARD